MVASTVAIALLLAACGGDGDGADTSEAGGGDGEPVSIVLLTHDSFAVSEGVLAGFTEETGITVELLSGGDAGAVLNQAILTRDNPTADVLFGVDNAFPTRALSEDIFIPYEAPGLDAVPDEMEMDESHRVTPIDYGDVCVNYDRIALEDAGLAPPGTLADLTAPEYAGMLVVQDPAGSSPGLAFLLATIATFGEDGDYTWEDYWTGLVANDVLVASGWEEAYYGSFSGGAGEGDRPLVVSYASSPPAEVFYAEEPPEQAPTGAITDGCFRQVEFAGILSGTEHEEAGRALIDFMLSAEFQEDIPLNMFVFPANEDAALPEVFTENTAIPEETAVVDPEDIDANRERWIQTWTDLLR
jgi:thiamine transport system substrate-binding protein